MLVKLCMLNTIWPLLQETLFSDGDDISTSVCFYRIIYIYIELLYHPLYIYIVDVVPTQHAYFFIHTTGAVCTENTLVYEAELSQAKVKTTIINIKIDSFHL